MDGYTVKIDELGVLIGDLGTAADRMADANRRLGGGGAFGSLGNADLGRAGMEFEEAWGYGIGRLGDAAAEVAERLKRAKRKYEQIEEQFGGELTKFGSAMASPGSSSGVPDMGDFADLADRPPDRPVGGGATGGITDLLGGLDR